LFKVTENGNTQKLGTVSYSHSIAMMTTTMMTTTTTTMMMMMMMMTIFTDSVLLITVM